MGSHEHNYPLIDAQVEQKLADAGLIISHHHYATGEQILTKGDISSEVHIILDGQVRVYIEQERKVQLALLEHGQFFGEMSCLTGDPISANVEAVTLVNTISVNRQGMMLLIDENAQFRMQIIESMVGRIQNSNTRVLEEHQKNLLLIQHHEQEGQERYGELIGESAPMQQLLHEVAIAAKSTSPLLIIGEPGTENVTVAREIHHASAKSHYPFIIVDGADLDLVQWESKVQLADGGTIVVEHADCLPFDFVQDMLTRAQQVRVILTAEGILSLPNVAVITVPPLRERVEDIPLLAKYFAVRAGATDEETAIAPDAMRLISLYPFLTKNTEELRDLIHSAYLLSEGRTIHGNHLRFGRNKKPGERPTIGLALGSGSARGTAHLGVLRVLEEEKIPIDFIAGSSAGALIGGTYAAGVSIDDSIKIMSGMKWGQFLRPTFPRYSFAQNTGMVKLIEGHIGAHNIEDLPIPFAAVAADLSTGEAHIMNSGSLAHAICASTAIPSVIRPVQYQGKTLVDGAVVHPVPAALVKSMGADIVIAVNVSVEKFAKGSARHFVDSLLNTIDMMSTKMVKEELQLADVVLHPDFGMNQITFQHTPFCVDAGMLVTREKIEQIHQKISAY